MDRDTGAHVSLWIHSREAARDAPLDGGGLDGRFGVRRRPAEWSRARMRELAAPFGTSFERVGEQLVVDLDG